MTQNNKTAFVIVAILILAGLLWFYKIGPTFGPKPVSHQFSGTLISQTKEGGLTLSGNYLKENSGTEAVVGSVVVVIRPAENLKITRTRTSLAKSADAGFSKPVSASDQKTEVVDMKQLLADVKSYNPVLTATASGNVYNEKGFSSSDIKYSITIVN